MSSGATSAAAAVVVDSETERRKATIVEIADCGTEGLYRRERRRLRAAQVGASGVEHVYAGTDQGEASSVCVQKVRICCITIKEKINIKKF